MAIPETAALWNLNAITASPTELAVKSGWWEQVSPNSVDKPVDKPDKPDTHTLHGC